VHATFGGFLGRFCSGFVVDFGADLSVDSRSRAHRWPKVDEVFGPFFRRFFDRFPADAILAGFGLSEYLCAIHLTEPSLGPKKNARKIHLKIGTKKGP
jgi:hypothetical protein